MTTTPLDADQRRRLAEQLIAVAEASRMRIWVLGPSVIVVRVIGKDKRYIDAPMLWRRLVYAFAPELLAMGGRAIRGRVAELRSGGCVVSRDGQACMAKIDDPAAAERAA
jgi:hypothetical protein